MNIFNLSKSIEIVGQQHVDYQYFSNRILSLLIDVEVKKGRKMRSFYLDF